MAKRKWNYKINQKGSFSGVFPLLSLTPSDLSHEQTTYRLALHQFLV